jgi:hypothetical protein
LQFREGGEHAVIVVAHPSEIGGPTGHLRPRPSCSSGTSASFRPGFPITAEDAAADINRVLVEAGLAVHRVEPVRASLEERFLDITSRLGVAA